MPQARQYKMKDSGVEWIGKVPGHWEVRPVKSYYSITTGFTPPSKNDSLYDENGEVWVTISDMNAPVISDSKQKISREYAELHKHDMAPKGSLLYSFKLSVGAVAFAGADLFTNEAIAAFHPSNDIDLYFLKYSSMLIIGNANVNIYGAKLMNQKLIYNAPVVFPPLPEQSAIASYLDEKCAAIDAIIAEAKATIEEYKLWKASIIFETVTKGLNPNAEMKDSGVEWIGSIPKAWQYVPLKYLASCNDEVLTEATPEDYTFDYIDIGSVHTGNGIGMCERMQFKDAPSRARRIVRDGDIIVSTVRTYLKAIAQVGNYDVPHIASTGFAVIRTKNANASFLKYALLSDNFVSQVEADSVGISYPAINATQIMAFKIPVPSIAEQTDIALYLDDKCAAIDGVIAEKEALIGELESYKKSLIFETVTGKRRVC